MRFLCRFTQVFSALVLLSLFPTGYVSECLAAEGDTESWRVIYVENKRVGYGRYISRSATQAGQPIYITEVEEHFKFRRFNQLLQMDSNLEIRETKDGQILGYTLKVQNPPALPTISKGTVKGRTLTIETTIGNRTRSRTIAWDPSWKSSGYQERSIQQKPLKAGEKRSFKIFLPELEKVANIHMSADDLRTVKLHDGKPRRLLKIRVDQSLVKSLKTRVYSDEKGNPLRTEMDPVGMVTFNVSKKVALEQIAGNELDVAVNSLVRVNNPPVNLHRAKQVVYRVTTPGHDPLEFFKSGPGQYIQRLSENSIELTVRPLEVPKNKPARRKQPAEFLADSKYLQIKDYRVRDHARKAGAGSTDAGTIATRMEKYVYRSIKKKGFSTLFASAAEVAKNLEGDCTEHSCLFAAMLRAHKIPSRVVVGFVYADRLAAFSSHMWTEAWLDGKWIALDSTLNTGFGAGHLKVIDTALADDGLTPALAFAPMLDLVKNVKIEVVRVER
jgi:transglutaminase-like putative cysteine protease